MLALTDAAAAARSGGELARLDEDGLLVVDDVLDRGTAAGLARRLDALLETEGEAAGAEFRHLVPARERHAADQTNRSGAPRWVVTTAYPGPGMPPQHPPSR